MTAPAIKRRFTGRPEQVSRARAFVKDVLGDCPLRDDAVLMTSELRTNALEHSASGDGGAFEVAVTHRPGALKVEVCDGGSAVAPVRKSVDGRAEAGRGLAIVESIADRWGHQSDSHGRCVYVELLCDHAIDLGASNPECPRRRPAGARCESTCPSNPARRKELGPCPSQLPSAQR